MKKKVDAFYKGQVQGVGFRYTARSVAKRYSVTGFVRNLYDGRVEVVAEGEEDVLNQFLLELKDKMNLFSFTEELHWLDADGAFSSFNISF